MKNKPKLKGVSGAVIADKIAKKQISGEEKRIVDLNNPPKTKFNAA